MHIISPSLLEADYCCLGEQLLKMKEGGARAVHIDIMDGQFVPNLSFGMKMVKCLRKDTDLFFDIHMMVSEPIRFVQAFYQSGADGITVHYEACQNVYETLMKIKQMGIKAGIALKPTTSIDVLTDAILETADVIHLMTVEPGIEGQSFIPESFNRIEQISQRLKNKDLRKDIEVDGSIDFTNAAEAAKRGATIFVSGKALFADGKIDKNIKKMNAVIHGVEEI